ncbi:MAG: ribonuclease HII [Chloroflexi bacterium]|nr:ribonuclease HII [Chloroflexota bacterium]
MGIDEVGRGAAASAVVACAIVLKPRPSGLEHVRDSKTLSSRERAALLPIILDSMQDVALGAASAVEIDRLNVRRATAAAMRRALHRIRAPQALLIDGLPMPEITAPLCRYVVDGDALSTSIACASIVAKQMRDHLLQRLALHYPLYGWDTNVGYLTPKHRAAILTHGPSLHHRRSFLKRVLYPMLWEASEG